MPYVSTFPCHYGFFLAFSALVGLFFHLLLGLIQWLYWFKHIIWIFCMLAFRAFSHTYLLVFSSSSIISGCWRSAKATLSVSAFGLYSAFSTCIFEHIFEYCYKTVCNIQYVCIFVCVPAISLVALIFFPTSSPFSHCSHFPPSAANQPETCPITGCVLWVGSG